MTRHNAWLSVLAVGIATAFGVWEGAKGSWLAALALLAIFALYLLLIAPPDVLPSLALVAFALWPAEYLPLSNTLKLVTPGTVLLLVWCLRSLSKSSPRTLRLSVCVPVLLAWLVIKTVTSIGVRTSFDWTATLAVDVVLVAWLAHGASPRARQTLMKTWLVLGTLIGAGAFVERAASYNPLSSLYVAGNSPLVQHWSVYRVTTTLGHPLMNGAFFATTAVLALFELTRPQAPRIRALAIAATLFSLLGVVDSVSRGSVIAVAVGMGVGMLLYVSSRRRTFGAAVILVILAGIAVYALLTSSLIASRDASSEGQFSSLYRSNVAVVGEALARADDFLGVGPGTAQRRFDQAGYDVIVENGPIELLVSIGVIGLGLILLSLRRPLVFAARRGEHGALAAVVTYLVAGAGFNLWETNLSAMGFMGLLLFLCVASRAPDVSLSPLVADHPQEYARVVSNPT